MPERPWDQLDSVLGPQSQWVCWASLPRAPVTLRMQLDGSELGGKGRGMGQSGIGTAFVKSLDSHTGILGTFPGKQ